LERNKEILFTSVPKEKRRTKKNKPVKLPQVMTEEEVMKILDTCQINTPVGLKDRAILELLYSTGIRRAELVNLNVEDFIIERGELVINQGKGKKDRIVPVGEYASIYTEGYLKLVRSWMAKAGEKALFVNSMDGTRLSDGTVGYLVEKAVKRSGINKRVTSHMFRHSMALTS
jgi:integrase/recombinase XerD